MLVSSLFLPFAGPFLMPFIAAPLAYARLRYGSANFTAFASLCVALVSIAGGFPGVTALVTGLAVAAYSLGGSVRAGEPDDRAVLKAALLPVLVVGPLMGLYYLLSGIDPWSLLSGTLDEGLKESAAVYRQMGMSQHDIDSVMPSLRFFVRAIVDYLPAVAISFTTLTGFVNYILLKRHAERTGVVERTDRPMNRWYAPDHAVWGVIVPGFLMVPPVPLLRVAAGNLLAVFAIPYLFQGMAVVSYFFEKLKLSPLLKALGFLLILMQPLLFLAMWCVGLADTWSDFRKVRPKNVRPITG